ncbi:large ribosomal subunit protein bL12m isoform 1-T1 [Pangshura tecta]
MLPAARPVGGPCLRGLRAAARLLLRQQLPGVCAVRVLRTSCHRRTEALASAPLDNAPKEYSPKIQQLVQDIASLTLLEISDLNELLKGSCSVLLITPSYLLQKTLKIQDMGLMPMGGMMPPPAMQSATLVTPSFSARVVLCAPGQMPVEGKHCLGRWALV